jgi:hypothetical protein
MLLEDAGVRVHTPAIDAVRKSTTTPAEQKHTAVPVE